MAKTRDQFRKETEKAHLSNAKLNHSLEQNKEKIESLFHQLKSKELIE